MGVAHPPRKSEPPPKELAMPSAVPSLLLVGAGRIGTALHMADAAVPAHHRRERVALVTRTEGDPWLALDSAVACALGTPICLCVRNDDLDSVLSRVPAVRHRDLVFLQNGMLRPWLDAHALTAATRGLLFFAVGQRGELPQPGAASPLCGPHALRVAMWLHSLGLDAQAVDAPAFAAIELEKLVWNCVFGLLCAVHGCDVGTICAQHRAEVDGLVAELLGVACATFGTPWQSGQLAERLVSYSLAIAAYRGAVKEWRWRNGWFVDEAGRRAIATPLHDRLLRQIGLPR